MGAATKKRTSGGTTLSVADLRTAFAAVAPAVNAKASRPVLASVRLGDGLLTATDLAVRIETAIDYHGEPFLLPYARLAAIMGAASGDEIEIEHKASSCVVRIGRGVWTLPTENVDEFPAPVSNRLQPVTKLPADQFRRAVRSVAHSAAADNERPALAAVLIDVQDGVVNFVATDGRRLSVCECEHDLAVDDSRTLVPSRVVDIIAKAAAAAGNGTVQIEASGTTITARAADTTITAALTAAAPFKWRGLIPDDHPDPTTVVGADLLATTRAAAAVASESSRGVLYEFAPESVRLTGKSAEYGESRVLCGVVEFGVACAVRLDPRFVCEWVQGLPTDGEPTVSIQARDAESKVVLRSDSYTGIIMPLEG
jgi:DNA polymerase-3 subunit beta